MQKIGVRARESSYLALIFIHKKEQGSGKNHCISFANGKKCPPGFLLLDLDGGIYIMDYMTSEFDWFMVTMPIFAIVVYLIVMIGSMEKQPKFLEAEGVKKLTGLVFVALFGGGILVSLYYMIIRFLDCLASY